MALTQVSEKCLLCDKPLELETDAIYVTVAQFTKIGRTYGSHGMSFGDGWSKVKEGKVRLRMKNGKPKGGVCRGCWDLAAILFLKKVRHDS